QTKRWGTITSPMNCVDYVIIVKVYTMPDKYCHRKVNSGSDGTLIFRALDLHGASWGIYGTEEALR
ncbi:hypothetical protein, partial [Escherichia coli]|uniref:hypothetical protein n=1 Tax=Escherichia coli TaxID=562 RepID=UPI0019554850